MLAVIEVIPFTNVHEMNQLLKINKNESTQVINHRVVIYKREGIDHALDDRLIRQVNRGCKHG